MTGVQTCALPILIKIKKEGIKNKQVGLVIYCNPLKGPNTTFWPIFKDNKIIGKVTSAVYSPRLKKNIALAIVSTVNSRIGEKLQIKINENYHSAEIVKKPFYDINKNIPSKNLS